MTVSPPAGRLNRKRKRTAKDTEDEAEQDKRTAEGTADETEKENRTAEGTTD